MDEIFDILMNMMMIVIDIISCLIIMRFLAFIILREICSSIMNHSIVRELSMNNDLYDLERFYQGR